MKKTKILVLAVAMSLGLSVKAYAFPANKDVLVVGSRAYDISTISSRFTNDNDFLNYVSNNSNNIYYVKSDDSGNATIQDVFGVKSIGESDLINKIGGRIDYYSGTSTVASDHWVTENGQYISSADTSNVSMNQFVTLQINPKPIVGNLYLFNFKINQLVGVPGAAFYSIGTSNIAKVTDTASYMFDATTISNGIPVYIYSDDMKTRIADATIKKEDISDSSGNVINSFTIKTIKFNNVTNPISAIASKYTVLGNMSNGGLLDSDSSYTYYVNTGDGNKIYKKNAYGTEDTTICDDNSGYITVYGDWIYYCNYSDGGKIYKVKTDGTRRQKISDNKGTYLNVIDDKLYYINASDGGKIYSLDSAGNSTKLSDDEATSLVLGTNKNLFYSNISEGKNLYKIDLYGNKSKVDDLGKSNPASYINVSINSPVAYYSSTDGNIYRSGDPYNPVNIRIQTKTGLVNDRVSNINISNSTIYYKSLVDGGKLYKVGTNGGVGQKISDDVVDGIFVYPNSSNQDDVYYTKAGKLYMLPANNGTTSTSIKGTAIGKPKATDKISSINSIPAIYTDVNDSSKTIDQIDVLGYLPEKVSAIMNSGSIVQLPVSWNVNNPKSKNGVYTYTGIVVGYGNKITADIAITSYAGLTLSNVHADNEIGNNDTITIDPGSLSKGDVVKVYDTKTTTKVAKTATVDSTGGVVIGGLNFGTDSGTVQVTVTKSGKAESVPLNVPFGPERGASPILSDWTFAGTTLTNDGTTTTINGIQISLTGSEQFYVGNYTDSNQADNDNNNWVNVNIPDGPYGSWNSATSTFTIKTVTVPTKDLQFGGNGKKLFIRKAGNPASIATTFMVNPRIPAPYGITFDETFGVIRGTTTNQEYSTNGGVDWQSCSNGNTDIGAFPNNPVMVRIKATKSTLAGLETTQVKITDMAGNNQSVAITSPADVNPDGTVSNNNNNIKLKSSIPVTWRVVDSTGQDTNAASIKSIDNQTAELTGYENGVVNVIATSTDGSNLQGNLSINVTNQPVITVKNTVELTNAISSGARVIKLLGIGGSYQLNTLSNLNNGNNDLTIIGQDATSIITVTAGSGDFADVNAGFTLNLKNLTLKGSDSSSVNNVINVNGGTVNLDGVYFDSLKGSNTTVGVNQVSGTVNINNSRFQPSNGFSNDVVINNGKITNSIFTGNSNFAGEIGAVNASGTVSMQGNNFTNYNQNNEYAIKLSSGFDSTTVGGVQKNYWNIINNSNIGIWLPNASSTDKNNLNINNSIDIRNTTIPVSTN